MTNEELDQFMNSDATEVQEETQTSNQNEDNPPPPSSDNRVVDQLDDVTKDSEKKASEIFDSLESINEYLGETETKINDTIKPGLEKNIEVFQKLTEQFPKIETFKESLKTNQDLLAMFENILDEIYTSQDEIMMIMDKMQYQDIHRQKIERVINVMRQLSIYMNHLFSSSIDDSKRVSSAKHIAGDERDDLVQEDDIEALIASFGK
jgi:chemotaxis regulatin CheY-phosphate phosphatase CheZ